MLSPLLLLLLITSIAALVAQTMSLDCPSKARVSCGSVPPFSLLSLSEQAANYVKCFDKNMPRECAPLLGKMIMEAAGKHPCKDQLHKHCRHQLQLLDKTIQTPGAAEVAIDVMLCVVENMNDIWQNCKPLEECRPKFDAACPAGPVELAQYPIVFWGEYLSRVRCAATTQELDEECAKKSLGYALDDAQLYFERDDMKPCKDTLHNVCSTEIEVLEKALKYGFIMSSIQASGHMTNCLVQNIKAIANICKKIPSPKPTPKPSKKTNEMVIADFVTQALGHQSLPCVQAASEVCAIELALSNLVSTEHLAEDEELTSASDFMVQMCLRVNVDRVVRQCDVEGSHSVFVGNEEEDDDSSVS